MKRLPVYRHGRIIAYCMVDDDVYEDVQAEVWHIQTRGTGGQVQVCRYEKVDGKTTNVFLAREIVGETNPAKHVYPKDGNPYNMTRENLEVAGHKRRTQHRAVDRRLNVHQVFTVPQLGTIGPVVEMAGRVANFLERRKND